MINHDELFISSSGIAGFDAAIKKRESFLDSPESIKLMSDMDYKQKEEQSLRSYIVTIQDGVGVVNISGGLVNSDDSYNKYCDLLSYEEINRAIIDLCEAGVTSALFNYDTPGGEGGRMLDIAEMISNLPFPTVGHTSTSCCSAGYFMACQHDHLYSNEMSSVGSVGVYLKIADLSEMYKSMGITFKRYRSGPLKATGDSAFKLTDEEDKYLSNRVMTLADKFYNIVSQARGIPLELLMESEIPTGRTFSGREAVANYLVDGIQSFEQSYFKVLQLSENATRAII